MTRILIKNGKQKQNMDPTTKLALETIQMKKQAIVFAPSRASAEKSAEEISKKIAANYEDLEQGILKAVSSPTKQCKRLALCIKKGIAFHHSGLTSKQKDLIEENFRSGKVKIICATPTLAAGVSLPAFRVIMKSLKRYSGKWGMDWIPVLEYMQMTGRAGRPEYEKFGEAISIAKNEPEKEEIYERFVCGKPEDIFSKLAVEPVLRTYLLSLIASRIIRDEKSMKEFFAKTFWAHQFKDMAQLEMKMEKMLDLLDEWGFITIHGKDFVAAGNMDNSAPKRLQATQLGKRVSELYLDPLTARYLLDCLVKYDERKNTFSLLQMISHTLEMRPLLRLKAKDSMKIQDELNKRYDSLLEEEPNSFDLEYNEFMNSIKTALFFESWANENTEEKLLEEFGIRPGEIRVKIEIADWLFYACEELTKIQDQKELLKVLRRVRTRVKNGVKEELLPLLRLKGIGRKRARRMFSQGIKDLGDVKKVDVSLLKSILGEKLSVDVKKQVGVDVTDGQRTL